MALPRTTTIDVPRRAYLVERYLSPIAAEQLAVATSRVAELCRDTGSAGVRYLYAAYLPSEDTCFCLFRAESAEAVRSVNTLAGFALDRISDAALLVCGDANGDFGVRL